MTIDELVIKLMLDSKDLTAKSGAATKQLKDLEGQGTKTEKGVSKLGKTSKETSSGVGELTGALGKFLAIIGSTAAIKAFISDMVESSATLERFSKNLGLSAGEVTQWGNATEEMGGSAKGLQSSLQMLSKAQTDLVVTGDSSLLPFFSMMGVAVADAGGHARSTTDILKDMASYAEGKSRTTMHNLFSSMGIDEGTINLLLLGRKELELNLQRQKDYGEQVAKFAPEALKMQRGLVDLKQTFTLLGLSLLQQATPALEKVLGVLQHVGSWLSEHKGFVLEFFKIFAAGVALVGAAFAAAELEDAPILLAILAIAGLAAGIALLMDDYKVWKEGGKSLINWGQWKTEIDAAAAGMEFLKKIALTAFEAIATAAKVAQDALHGNWGQLKTDLASGTTKMNKNFGIGGPDEAHDQNAAKADVVVKKVANFFRALHAPPASFDITGGGGNYKPGAVSSAIGQMEGFHKKGSRAQRNHNPGNIEWGDFAKAHGATGVEPGGRFAVFPDDTTGYKALDALLASKKYAGKTIEEALSIYAPSSENDTKGYAAFVRKTTGASATATVAQAQMVQPTRDNSLTRMLNGIQGASSSVAQAGRSGGGSSSTSNDNSTTVTANIASVNIQAPSGDANAIARVFSKGMNPIFTSYANAGLN